MHPVRRVLLWVKKWVESLAAVGSSGLHTAQREIHFWDSYPLPITERIRAWRFGFLSRGYVLLELERGNPRKYISDMQQSKWIRPAVNSSYADIIENKVAFLLATAPYTDSVPRLFGTIESGEFTPHKSEQNNIQHIIEDEGQVVVKPTTGSGGKRVHKIVDRGGEYSVNGVVVSRSELADLLSDMDDFVVVEFVEQHEYAADIWPESANTIRMLTVMDPEDGEFFVASAVHRFGASGTGPTDNWSGGGVAAPIDVESGELGMLVRYGTETGVERFGQHPETGTDVCGERIPEWENIKETVLGVANLHRQNPYVGWDVVLTDDGPVILEGNCAPHSHLQQLAGGLLEDERVRRFFQNWRGQ